MRSVLVITGLFLLSQFPLAAQVYGGINYLRADRAIIPFDYQNDLILVEVLFNGLPLRFIFDTGAEHTMLTRREITDMLAVSYHRKYTIYGADLSTELTAYLAYGIQLKLGNLELDNRNVLVLEEDYFNFSSFTGEDIHGILGADIFRHFVVEIDYQRERIVFYPRETFPEPGDKFVRYPVEIHRGRPYLQVPVKSDRDSIIHTKLLMDTGAGLAMMLYPETSSVLAIPERAVPGQFGVGLGGFLVGVVGRVQEIELAGHPLTDVVTSFQQLGMVIDSVGLNQRNGLLGNQSLSHFHWYIDYIKEQLYLRPVGGRSPRFTFDRSGLFLVASGKYLNEFQVAALVPGSPAAEAGLQVGDRLIRINGIPCSWLQLETLQGKFKRRIGKRYRLVYEREGQRYNCHFRLARLI